jgi:chromosome segregation ATPase
MQGKNAEPSARVLVAAEDEEILAELAALDAAFSEDLSKRVKDCTERGDDELATALKSVADRLMTHLEGTREAYSELLRLIAPTGRTAPRVESLMALLHVTVQTVKRRAGAFQKQFAGLREAVEDLPELDPEILRFLNRVSKRSDASQRELAGVERALTKLQERLVIALATGNGEMKRDD